MEHAEELKMLLRRIPRRHSLENVKEINSITKEYEDLLIKIEATNDDYAKRVENLFSDLETIRFKIKSSTEKKASKRHKDLSFDEASGKLKDDIQSLLDKLN